MTQYVIDFDNAPDDPETIACSPSPSTIEKEYSNSINSAFEASYGEHFRNIGYQKVNFSVEIIKNTIIVKESFLVRDNGDVEILEIGHKHRIKGHSISTRLKRKASAMSIQIPTPLIIFQKEIEATFKEGFLAKMGITALISSMMMLAGITVEQLLIGFSLFIIIALLDGFLGIMPNTLKENENSKDHNIQAKFLMFVVNFAGMTVLLAIHVFMINLVPDPSVLMYVPVNVHFIGIMYIIVSYSWRIFSYLAIANKTKAPLPDFLSKPKQKD